MTANECVQSFADILSNNCSETMTVSADIRPSIVMLSVSKLNAGILEAIVQTIDSPDRVRDLDVAFGIHFS